MRLKFRARFERGVLRPLEPVEMREGMVVNVQVEDDEDGGRVVEETFGLAKRLRPGLTSEEIRRVIEEVEDEDIL